MSRSASAIAWDRTPGVSNIPPCRFVKKPFLPAPAPSAAWATRSPSKAAANGAGGYWTGAWALRSEGETTRGPAVYEARLRAFPIRFQNVRRHTAVRCRPEADSHNIPERLFHDGSSKVREFALASGNSSIPACFVYFPFWQFERHLRVSLVETSISRPSSDDRPRRPVSACPDAQSGRTGHSRNRGRSSRTPRRRFR